MIGPLPVGSYNIVGPFTWKGMINCFELEPHSSNSMCGRSGFLIHGGSCSPPYDPSEGCIVIEDSSLRGRIKGGTVLNVVSGSAGSSSTSATSSAPQKTTSNTKPSTPSSSNTNANSGSNTCSRANCISGGCTRGCPCGPTPNVLSAADVEHWCSQYSGWNLASCKCIVNAESSGNSNEVNQNTDSHHTLDVGLWQINEQNWAECSGGAAPCSLQANLNCAKKIFDYHHTWQLWATCHKCGVCNSR